MIPVEERIEQLLLLLHPRLDNGQRREEWMSDRILRQIYQRLVDITPEMIYLIDDEVAEDDKEVIKKLIRNG